MPRTPLTLVVPPLPPDQIDVLIAGLKEAVESSGVADAEEVYLSQPSTKTMSPTEIGVVLLVLPATAATWFTSQWFKAYVWPAIDRRIGKRSREFVEIVERLIERSIEKLAGHQRDDS